MNIKKALPFKLLMGVLLGLTVSGIWILGMVSFQYNRKSIDSFHWVRHSYLVIDLVDEIASLYKDIQMESIAYYISDVPHLIPFYTHSKVTLWEKINRVRILTSDNNEQQIRLDSLELLLKSIISSADSVFSLDKNDVYSDIYLVSKVKSNADYRNRIRRIIQDMKKEENRLLTLREEANLISITAFNRTFYLLLGGVCILLVTTFFFVRHYFNKRIRYQQELKKANELFYKLFHESPIGIMITRSSDGLIIDCNRAYSELINYSREEIIGKTPEMLKTVDIGNYDKVISGAVDLGKAEDIELQLKPKGRSPLWASVSIQAINIQNRQCLLFAIMDMTLHKQAEDKIKKALETEKDLNRMKSDFVTLASHEFRTPLSTILSSAFLLENSIYGENMEIITKHVGRIKSCVSNITFLLDEFLSLSKIEENKLHPKLEQLNVKEYLESFLPSLNNLIKPGQKIIYQHSGDHYYYTDPDFLMKIVNNLVSNSLKYSGENSQISISSRINGQLRIDVEDSGIGIPAEDQKHLFERFFRASNAVAIQGSGLGLYILKYYIELLNGTIEIKSEMNKGTAVKVILGNLPKRNPAKN